jgi:S1-C subfamily serine protease
VTTDGAVIGIPTLTAAGSADGTPTPDTQALASVLAAAHPGDQLTLSVTRGTQELTVHLTLGELPAAAV